MTFPSTLQRLTRIALIASTSATILSACSIAIVIWSIHAPSADPLFRFLQKGKAGYIDASGKIVIPPTLPPNGNWGGEFHEGVAAIREENGYRYINRDGTILFHIKASLAQDFSEGLAAVSLDSRQPKSGFIDRTGNFAIPPKFTQVETFSEGLALVTMADGTGFIDRTGDFVIPPTLSYGSSFHEGRAAVIVSGLCRSISGGSCARPEFRPTRILPDYDCRFAYIDKTGTPISELRFDDAKDFSAGLAPVRVRNLWGYVDRTGQFTVAPRFESAEPFFEGLAVVHQDGKAGYIDPSGAFVIPPQFEWAGDFSNGRALVPDPDTKGSRFINKSGTPAFPGRFALATSFVHGLAGVSFGPTKMAWINLTGKPVFTYNPE